MFDLEKAVDRWKKNLRAMGSLDDGDLAELEDFFMNKVEDLTARGMSPEDACAQAEAEFASAERLEANFLRAGARHPGNRFLGIGAFIRTGIRHGLRHKGFAILAIGSLALAVAMLTLGWARYEMSYDRFHRRADSIYRFIYKSGKGDTDLVTPGVPNALRLTVKDILPDVAAASFGISRKPPTSTSTFWRRSATLRCGMVRRPVPMTGGGSIPICISNWPPERIPGRSPPT